VFMQKWSLVFDELLLNVTWEENLCFLDSLLYR